MSHPCTVAVITAWLLVSVGSPATGEVYIIFGNQARFDLFAQAPAIPILHPGIAFPGTTCGTGDRGSRGSWSSVIVPFGTNSVTITGGKGSPLCLFGGSTGIIQSKDDQANIQPTVLPASTMEQDTVKDLQFLFHHPVQAVAFWLLTGHAAREVAIFTDAAGNRIDQADIHRFTLRNDPAVVGFVSRTPFTKIELAIDVGQPGPNEGIQAMRIAETVAFPGKRSSE